MPVSNATPSTSGSRRTSSASATVISGFVTMRSSSRVSARKRSAAELVRDAPATSPVVSPPAAPAMRAMTSHELANRFQSMWRTRPPAVIGSILAAVGVSGEGGAYTAGRVPTRCARRIPAVVQVSRPTCGNGLHKMEYWTEDLTGDEGTVP